MATNDPNIPFNNAVSGPQAGLSVFCDAEGFSRFVATPDGHVYVPKFLNLILHGTAKNIGVPVSRDGTAGLDGIQPGQVLLHKKFLGDGTHYLLVNQQEFGEEFSIQLLNRLRSFKRCFGALVQKCGIPLSCVPQVIKFGIGAGPVYELAATEGGKEYFGNCINLASRLERYCPPLGFIASARLGISAELWRRHGYVQVLATELKGLEPEVVIVDKKEFEALDGKLRRSLFS